jgi:hypothetical protein
MEAFFSSLLFYLTTRQQEDIRLALQPLLRSMALCRYVGVSSIVL